MTDIKVSGLAEILPKSPALRLQTYLENVEVDEEGGTIVITEDHFEEEQNPKKHTFELDDLSERAVCRFLKIPFKYIEECPGPLKATNLNHWLKSNADSAAVFYANNDFIEAVYSPEKIILPTSRIGEIVTQVFDGEDTITGFHSDNDVFQIDVTSERWQVNTPGNGVLDRPKTPEVDDITHAGVRIYVPADLKAKRPVVTSYLNRLICSNGMTFPEVEDEIKLKGKNLDDILEEMEDRANELLSGLDARLTQLNDTAQMKVPGNYLAFIRQVGKERGVSSRVLDRALDYAAGQGDMEWTLFDVIQLFTSFAAKVPFAQAQKLQSFGGLMAANAEEILARCTTCEQLLPGHVHNL